MRSSSFARSGGARTIGFCVSQRHADFMADSCASARGCALRRCMPVRTSAPRTASLAALRAGELDVIFAVDMFNEGVDVPEIDTVLMLRPTESPVIWLQQFGRGLRRAEGKARLSVIDYIGAHRSFLTKARALLQVTGGDRALATRLREVRNGELALPPGCEVVYDTVVIDMMEKLLRLPSNGDGEELDAFYDDFRLRHGERPTAAEVQHAGFDPRRTGHGGWFAYVSDRGDLDEDGRRALDAFGGLLNEVESGPMTRSGKMLVLAAMIDEGAFPGRAPVSRLAARVARLARRNPRLTEDLGVDANDLLEVSRLLRRDALKAWAEADAGRWFELEDLTFATRFAPSPDVAVVLTSMISELVDWRVARHLAAKPDRVFPAAEAEITGAAEAGTELLRAERWREYMREEIPRLFGDVFQSGSWNSGIVPIKKAKALILLVTLKKGSLSSGNHYEDRFESPEIFRWQTQTSTRRDDRRGSIISGAEPGWSVHLFVRGSKLRDGRAAPFRYCGAVSFLDWDGDAPISVRWRLAEPAPVHLHGVLGVSQSGIA